MKFRIRTIELTASGREIVREKEVEGEEIGIGRATDNAIHLPDLAVEQHHVRLVPTADGAITAESVGRLGFAANGRKANSATIRPERGGELGIGSYRLELSREADGHVAITVRRDTLEKGESRDKLRGFSLAPAMPGKRAMAWIGALVALIAFLAVPVWSHLNRPAAEPAIVGDGAVMWDASWSPGALSSAHHGLEDNCEACHAEPFQAVRDETCLTCHEDIADHAEAPRMAAGMAQPTGGDALLWRVAHAFGKPGPGACTDCHTEHEGTGAMEPAAQQFCADCHDTLDTRLADTTLGNAADFGVHHPQFKALVLPGSGAAEPVRMTLAADLADHGGLRFPHKLHLSRNNGVARMAGNLVDEYGAPLECADCHTPTADGVRFLPVDMEDDCESCHSLVYDRVGSTFRTLHHGNVEQIEADLAALDRTPRRPVSTGRQRPGQFAQGGLYYGNFSRVTARRLGGDALAPDGLCGECHLPATGSAGGRLEVMPVVQRSRYFQHGWFDHAAHTQEDCSTCHAAENSTSATDLLLPGIATCRDCHEGADAISAEVPSTCAMCHSYHPREGPAAAPPRIAGQSVPGLQKELKR